MGSPRRGVGRLVAPVAALLVVAVVVALLAATAPAQNPALRVSMFGDSVMLGAREELLARFAGQPVTVDAVEDRSLLGAISLFRSAGPALGDVVVLDLGYNDSSDPVVFRGRIDEAMAALAAVPRVLWLNQHDWGGRAGMNAELAAAASRYPNLEVIDWNAEVAAHPEDVYGDAIHLTTPGQEAMATLVRQHYDRFVESLTPTTTTEPLTTTTSTVPPTTSDRVVARSATDDDPGIANSTLAIGGGVVVLLLGAGTALSVGRRARRGTPRDR